MLSYKEVREPLLRAEKRRSVIRWSRVRAPPAPPEQPHLNSPTTIDQAAVRAAHSRGLDLSTDASTVAYPKLPRSRGARVSAPTFDVMGCPISPT